MATGDHARSAEAIRRKLRALAAVFSDPSANANEKANARELKARLEKRLVDEPPSRTVWTGLMFRLGRGVKDLTSQPAPKGDWTDHAFRLGRMVRKGLKR
jgi:hypothetical protein